MRRLIVVGPLPPPVHGVSVSTSLVLASALLRERFAVEHLDTTDRRSGTTLGRWDARNVRLGLIHGFRLARRCSGERGLVYLPISQGSGGFLRDSLLIHIAHLRGWTVVAHLRGSEFGRFVRRSPRPLRGWISATLRRLTAVAVMGESLRGILAGLVPDERIGVVANGTTDPGINDAQRDGESVLFLSHLRRRKGVNEALECALRVLEQRPTARFVFAGDWEDEQLETEMRAAAAAVDGRISFVSSTSDGEKNALLAVASVLLFPPIEPEGHPRVVLEAMAAGLPVIATDRGAIAETIVDGECGFVLSDPRPDDLAACALFLLDHPDVRTRMGKASRERYLSHFTQERSDEALLAWLEQVWQELVEKEAI